MYWGRLSHLLHIIQSWQTWLHLWAVYCYLIIILSLLHFTTLQYNCECTLRADWKSNCVLNPCSVILIVQLVSSGTVLHTTFSLYSAVWHYWPSGPILARAQSSAIWHTNGTALPKAELYKYLHLEQRLQYLSSTHTHSTSPLTYTYTSTLYCTVLFETVLYSTVLL